MDWFADWTLPDPKGGSARQVRVTESHFRHIFNQHFSSRHEPWADVFSPPLLESLRQCWALPPKDRAPVLDQAAAILQAAVRRGLQRPLVCAYTQLDADRYELHSTWEVVTRPGFVAVVRLYEDRSELKTAYFPRAACGEKAQRRWIAAAKWVVQTYAFLDKGTGYLLPDEGAEFPSSERGRFVGNRVDVEFLTPETWGFRDGLWRGGPLPWREPDEH